MHNTTKVFWSGQWQAVRLPREFRFPGQEVRIRKQGASVILEPIPRGGAWLDALKPLDAADAARDQPGGRAARGWPSCSHEVPAGHWRRDRLGEPAE